jgi:hypothetical protein
MQKVLTNWHKYDRGIWGYGCLGIGGFGKMITRLIIHWVHYTYILSPLCSTMLNKLISKIYLWINLCITYQKVWISMWICV